MVESKRAQQREERETAAKQAAPTARVPVTDKVGKELHAGDIVAVPPAALQSLGDVYLGRVQSVGRTRDGEPIVGLQVAVELVVKSGAVVLVERAQAADDAATAHAAETVPETAPTDAERDAA